MVRNFRPAVSACAAALLSIGTQAAQQAAPRPDGPKFDVVSVKPCDRNAPGAARGGEGGRGGSAPITSPGRLYLECYSLSTLIDQAYVFFAGGRAHSLWASKEVTTEGGPGWMASARFTIEAKASASSPEPSPAMMRGPMLQAVLEDRFKLRVHHETRDLPVYALVVAKSGAKVTPFTGTDCVPKDDAAWPPPAPPAGQTFCATKAVFEGDRVIRSGVTTLDDLASIMSLYDRPIVNRTGITGLVRFRLELTRADMTISDATPPPPSLIVAIRNQLGLDLRPDKGPRDFLVIDHAERPTPDGVPAQSADRARTQTPE